MTGAREGRSGQATTAPGLEARRAIVIKTTSPHATTGGQATTASPGQPQTTARKEVPQAPFYEPKLFFGPPIRREYVKL